MLTLALTEPLKPGVLRPIPVAPKPADKEGQSEDNKDAAEAEPSAPSNPTTPAS